MSTMPTALAPTLADRAYAIRPRTGGSAAPDEAIARGRTDKDEFVLVAIDAQSAHDEPRWARITLPARADAANADAATANAMSTLAARDIACLRSPGAGTDLLVPWSQRRRALCALTTDAGPMPADDAIDAIARKYDIGAEPSMVDEYARLSCAQRGARFLRLRRDTIEKRYGPDQRFERVCTVARRA